MSLTKIDSRMVEFTPAGTGAVVQEVQTKLRESVSVKDFGAVGDGVTDDTAAIQSAIDHMHLSYIGGSFGGNAGTVVLGPKVYRHSGLILKKGVNLVGAGQVNTILLLDTDGATGIKTPAKSSQVSADAVSQSTIKGIGFGIHSSLTPSIPTVLLDSSGLTKSKFDDLAFRVPSNVIGIDNTGNTLAGSGGPAHWYNTWSDVHVYVTGGLGIRWGENDSSLGEQVTAQAWFGGSIKGLTGTGIHIRGGTGISFHGTTFENMNSGSDNTIILGDTSGSRVTRSVNFHGCYFEQVRLIMYSNTSRCLRWGGKETSLSVTDNGIGNSRADYDQLYRGWPRVYVSGRVTTSGLVINKSYGVNTTTGVTKIGTGIYNIPFSTAMPDTNYVAQAIVETNDLGCRVSTKNQSFVRFYFFDTNTKAAADPTSFAFTVIDNDVPL